MMRSLKLFVVIGLICALCVFLTGCRSSVFLSEEMTEFEVLDEKPEMTSELEQKILDENSYLLALHKTHQLTDEQRKIIEEWIKRAVYFSEFDYENPDKFEEEAVISKLSEQGYDEMMMNILAENYDLDRRMLSDLQFKSTFEVQLGDRFYIDEYNKVYVAGISTIYIENVEKADLYKYAKEILEEVEENNASNDDIIEKDLNRARDFYLENKGKWLLTQKDLLYFDFDYEDTNLWDTLKISPSDFPDFNLSDEDFFIIEEPNNEDEVEEVPVSAVILQGKIVQGRFLVPMRGIFEELGATVNWDGDTRTVTGTKDNTSVELIIDSDTAKVNEKTIELDVAATLIDGRTYVPTRFVGESLGADVVWDGEKRMATITQNGTIIEVHETKP